MRLSSICMPLWKSSWNTCTSMWARYAVPIPSLPTVQTWIIAPLPGGWERMACPSTQRYWRADTTVWRYVHIHLASLYLALEFHLPVPRYLILSVWQFLIYCFNLGFAKGNWWRAEGRRDRRCDSQTNHFRWTFKAPAETGTTLWQQRQVLTLTWVQ